MKTFRTKIGQRIRYFRNKRGLTQRELGLLLGFSQSTAEVRMNQYELGFRGMKQEGLRKLAEVLQVDKAALCVPELKELNDVRQLLFAMEDCGLVKIVKAEGKYFLQLDMQQAGFADGERLLAKWQEKREMLAQGKISEAEYDAWRYGEKE